MKALEGKIALVTGVGRTSGIGFAMCKKMAEMGADIFYTYWHPYDANSGLAGGEDDPISFVSLLESYNVRVAQAEIDLSVPDAPTTLFDMAESMLGTPDILVNNACVSTNQPFLEVNASLLDAHYAVNVRAATLLCKEFALRFKKQTGGKILNLTSGQSVSIMRDELPYAITKAALEMLSLQLSVELRDRGITVNAIDPGPTDTGWITPAIRAAIESEPNPVIIHTPAEIAEVMVAYLAGEKEGTTGSVHHIGREDMMKL